MLYAARGIRPHFFPYTPPRCLYLRLNLRSICLLRVSISYNTFFPSSVCSDFFFFVRETSFFFCNYYCRQLVSWRIRVSRLFEVDMSRREVEVGLFASLPKKLLLGCARRISWKVCKNVPVHEKKVPFSRYRRSGILIEGPQEVKCHKPDTSTYNSCWETRVGWFFKKKNDFVEIDFKVKVSYHFDMSG